jgi:hypothetical protein
MLFHALSSFKFLTSIDRNNFSNTNYMTHIITGSKVECILPVSVSHSTNYEIHFKRPDQRTEMWPELFSQTVENIKSNRIYGVTKFCSYACIFILSLLE